jgi:hypothetical protein
MLLPRMLDALLELRDVSDEWWSQGRPTLLDHSVTPVELSCSSSWKKLEVLEERRLMVAGAPAGFNFVGLLIGHVIEARNLDRTPFSSSRPYQAARVAVWSPAISAAEAAVHALPRRLSAQPSSSDKDEGREDGQSS